MTDAASLLGLTEQEVAQLLDARKQPWTVRRCSPARSRPEGCVQRVVRARHLDDGTVEVTLSGFCDYPRGGGGLTGGNKRTGTEP